MNDERPVNGTRLSTVHCSRTVNGNDMKQESLRPHDVAVLLQLLLSPDPPFRDLAGHCALSVGEAHNAVSRLRLSGLAGPAGDPPNRRGALEFLTHGAASLGRLYRTVQDTAPDTASRPGIPSLPPAIPLRRMRTSILFGPAIRNPNHGSENPAAGP